MVTALQVLLFRILTLSTSGALCLTLGTYKTALFLCKSGEKKNSTKDLMLLSYVLYFFLNKLNISLQCYNPFPCTNELAVQFSESALLLKKLNDTKTGSIMFLNAANFSSSILFWRSKVLHSFFDFSFLLYLVVASLFHCCWFLLNDLVNNNTDLLLGRKHLL